MAYPVSRIVPLNLNIRQAGIQYANFVTIRAVATPSMLEEGASLDVDEFRTYDGVEGVANDFSTDSAVYYMAQIWFGQTPTPGASSFQVWMWDNDSDEGDTLIETLDKSEQMADWTFFVCVEPSLYQSDQQTALDLAAWATANKHLMPFTFSSASNTDQNTNDDVATAVLDQGSRYVTQKFVAPSLVSSNPREAYAPLGELAYFQRFSFEGINTTVDPNFAALQLVSGSNLRPNQYTALEDKKLGFYTPISLQGESTSARVLNSWTTSSYNETVDDVFSLAVLANRMQVDGFNYLSARKRGLRTPKDYGGLISTVEAVARQANQNGTLASNVVVTHPRTGDDVQLKYGFLTLSNPEDVQNLTEANISSRSYPPVQILVALAYGARVAQINLTVE